MSVESLWCNRVARCGSTVGALVSRIGAAVACHGIHLPQRPQTRPGLSAKRVGIAATAAAVLAALSLSSAADARTAQEAQSLAERAVAHVKEVGRDRAFADFSDPDGGFVDGELYVFCEDISGVVIAHGGNPKLVGHNMAGVRDPDGRLPNVEVNHLGLTQGSGWLEFRWPNPATKRIELKAAYVIKVDDSTVCGSGYYKGNAQ